MRCPLLLIPLLMASLPAAERGWAHGDPEADGVAGTRTAKAYAELTLRAPPRPVVVAVIDTGADLAHEDLAGRWWTNPREAAGETGTDDDGNGYVDDVSGWNFLGSRDGRRQLEHASLEVTREYARLLAEKAMGGLDDERQAYLARVEGLYFARRSSALQEFLTMASMSLQCDQALGKLRRLGLRETTPEAIAAFAATQPRAALPAAVINQVVKMGLDPATLARSVRERSAGVLHHYDLEADPSAVIGDDPADLTERGYGNPGVAVANAHHGTHVAGIIAATRGNDRGIDGQCAWARIMPIVAVPDGDERDKDVANAIRYAVDNGARIITCSFGKGLSPQLAVVEAALRHAEAHDVLIVHAAGNEAEDLDRVENYPSPVARSDGATHRFANWIEVGASGPEVGPNLVAEFSNYGRTMVDCFAPGVDIDSTIPGGYERAEGTSMAAPQVAGVAALVWSQHPRLSAAEVRAVLLTTVRTFPGLAVRRPGSEGLVGMKELCLSGGIVDAYEALGYLADTGGVVLAEDRARVDELTAQACNAR